MVDIAGAILGAAHVLQFPLGGQAPGDGRADGGVKPVHGLGVEAAIVERALDRVTEDMIRELAEHIGEEQAAHARGDHSAAIRLSGAFHLRLARIAGNEVLLAFLQELVSRTSLIIATYGTQSVSACSHDDHEVILQALRAHDAAAAVSHMDHHLRFIEEHLQLISGGESDVDLKTILSE